MRPDIGAVIVHEDCDVAHDADRLLRAVTPQRPPLFVEGELQRASNLEIGGQFLCAPSPTQPARDAPDRAATDSSFLVFAGRAEHRREQNPPATKHFPRGTCQTALAHRPKPSAGSSAPPQTAAASSARKPSRTRRDRNWPTIRGSGRSFPCQYQFRYQSSHARRGVPG